MLILLLLPVSSVFLVTHVTAASDYPCSENWVYSRLSGKCYLFYQDTLDYAASLQKCQRLLPGMTAAKLIGLSKILTVDDATGMRDELIRQGNNALMWLDCFYNGSLFLWSDGSVVNLDILRSLAPSANLTGPCLMIAYTYSLPGSGAVLGYQIQSTLCNQSASYFCQHNAVMCQPSDIHGFSSNVEVLVPPYTTVGSMPYVSCSPGNYRKSELTPAPAGSDPGTIPLNYANCTGTQASDSNPFNYKPIWVLNGSQSTIEACSPISCYPFNGTLVNVQSQVVVPPTVSSYNFGDSFPVTCITGFVNYANPSSNMAAVTCSQSTSKKQVGLWNPQSNAPCVPLMCNKTLLLGMVPGNGMLASARNRGNQRIYNVNLQQSSLPYYDNIITIQCNDGFFFSDRTYQKSIICGLQNGSLVQGQWLGYLGTVLPLDTSCQSVSCTVEAITMTPKMNLQSTFFMMDTNGNYQNLSQLSTNPYPFQTKMRFLCMANYSSVNQASDQNLTCGPQGVWIPNLTPCVMVTPSLNLGNNLHYLPPAVNAPAATQVGYVVIVILVVFLSLIVILDISTLNRDIKTMRTNIKNLKRFMNRSKT